jgi:Ankyrin repeat.
LLFGDDINKKDFNKTSALHFAAWENHIDIVDMLLDWGIFSEETEGKGWTALHDSVRREYHDIFIHILAKARGLTDGAAVMRELERSRGEERFLKLLKILSDYHVSLDAIGICGHGLLYDAKTRGYHRAEEYLRNKGVTYEE